MWWFKPLGRSTAIKELTQFIEINENNLMEIIVKRTDKEKFIDELTWYRERIFREFFNPDKYQGLNTRELLAANLLIIRLRKRTDFQKEVGGIYYPAEVELAVKTFDKVVHMRNLLSLLKEEIGEAIDLPDGRKIVPNENYFPILETYEDNDIMAQDKAEEKMLEYKKVFDLLFKNTINVKIKYSPEEFISTVYPTINQLVSGLFRNGLYYEAFGALEKYSEFKITPDKLMELVNSFEMFPCVLSYVPLNVFLDNARKILGLAESDVYEHLIFSEKNQSVFPLFILFEDTVFVSHRFSFVMYILLHAIIHEEILDQETVRRSKEFEKEEVKRTFESLGWQYFHNITDKSKKQSLEIDGIATLHERVLIVECKGWKLTHLYELKKRQDALIRDIKGVVDGFEYTNGKSSKKPSLLDKIKFVNEHMDQLGLDPDKFREIKGVVIMKSFPPITEYKGVKIISIKDIPNRFS